MNSIYVNNVRDILNKYDVRFSEHFELFISKAKEIKFHPYYLPPIFAGVLIYLVHHKIGQKVSIQQIHSFLIMNGYIAEKHKILKCLYKFRQEMMKWK